jgi:hypothetical protein
MIVRYMMAIKPILEANNILSPKVGHSRNNKTGMDKPLNKGNTNQARCFITMARSKEIKVPKKPPTIKYPVIGSSYLPLTVLSVS